MYLVNRIEDEFVEICSLLPLGRKDGKKYTNVREAQDLEETCRLIGLQRYFFRRRTGVFGEVGRFPGPLRLPFLRLG